MDKILDTLDMGDGRDLCLYERPGSVLLRWYTVPADKTADHVRHWGEVEYHRFIEEGRRRLGLCPRKIPHRGENDVPGYEPRTYDPA